MTRLEPRWVPRVVVEAVQLDQVREHGGLIGLRDEDALEGALARARQRWSYDPASDLPRLAAAYTFGICSGHPFRDGNKRISFLTAVIFLGLNGLDLVAPEEEVAWRRCGPSPRANSTKKRWPTGSAHESSPGPR